jgi:hypothetical protein
MRSGQKRKEWTLCGFGIRNPNAYCSDLGLSLNKGDSVYPSQERVAWFKRYTLISTSDTRAWRISLRLLRCDSIRSRTLHRTARIRCFIRRSNLGHGSKIHATLPRAAPPRSPQPPAPLPRRFRSRCDIVHQSEFACTERNLCQCEPTFYSSRSYAAADWRSGRGESSN